MAAQRDVLRSRKDPVARFNTFEQPDPEIKAQIAHASRTQRALRSQVPQWPSKQSPPEDDFEGLQPAPTVSHHIKALETRPESVSVVGDLDRHSLDRTFSFNSLSTLQRDAEATRLQQWRDSPVSAFSPIDRVGCPVPELKQDDQDQYPALAVYKLKQSRKDEKEQRKSIKKKEKELKKAEKAAAHRRRHSMANVVATHQPPDNIDKPTTSDTSSPPRRAISDPSFKASREAAAHLIKRLASKPMTRLSRRSKVPQSEAPKIPHIDDFISKPALQDYLNSEFPEPNLPIAELPGPLPPYTPFENSTANENNCAISSDPAVVGSASVYRSPSAPNGHCNDPSQPPRMMRCDKCQFGIKLDDEYFHCKICQNGDRIICRACDADGESCRHELTKRRRYVLGYADGLQETGSSRHNTRRRHEDPAKGANFSSANDMHRLSNASTSGHHVESRSHPSRSAGYEGQDRKHLLDLRDIGMRRREQDLLFREREAFLREREATLRERQTQFQTREADAGRRVRDQEATISRQYVEMATILSTQFANLQTQFAQLTISKTGLPSALGSSSVPDEEDVLDMSPEQGVRAHAGKRKASGTARTGSNNATTASSARYKQASHQNNMHQDSPDEDEDGDEEDSGTPKKVKQDSESATSLGKLYACHFCKHNSLRYSEKNNSEKHYRGCSSGYWPDISRLKQHLYRVHWRGHHCEQCFTVFKKSQDLQSHARTRGCQGQDCPFPEKFSHAKYNEIRKKRPTNTAEEVWYIIYDILFPGEAQPETPYADSVEDSTPSFASPTVSPALPTWDALGCAFDSRLDQYQDVPSQAWLRLPGAREFIREQLRASMADVLKSVTPATTPAVTPLPTGGSPSSPSRHDSSQALSVAATSSVPASPVVHSATSSRSASSAQWRLPNHRRSFSRPLLPSVTRGGSNVSGTRPTLTVETTSDPSDVNFAIATSGDPENDSYDSESGSWHQNDDSSGLAITAGSFNFDFDSFTAPQMLETQNSQDPTASDMVPPPRPLQRSFEFRPVKVSTLVDGSEGKTPLAVKPIMIDSAYGSLESSHGDGSGRPSRLHVKSTTASHIKSQVASQDLDVDMSVPEHELNMDALEIPFQQFLGAEMDECGNIEGRNLTEYLYGQGGLIQ